MNDAPSDHPAPKPDRSSPLAARAWSHTSDHDTPADPGPATVTNGTDAENNPVRSSIDPDNPSPKPIAPDTGPAAAAGAARPSTTTAPATSPPGRW